MSRFKCPRCGKEFEMPYLKWIFTTLFHRYSFKEYKDYRLTKCPYWRQKTYMKRLK